MLECMNINGFMNSNSLPWGFKPYVCMVVLWSYRAKGWQHNNKKIQHKVTSKKTTFTKNTWIALPLCPAHPRLALLTKFCCTICRMTSNYLRTTFRSKHGHNTQLSKLKPAEACTDTLQSIHDVESFSQKFQLIYNSRGIIPGWLDRFSSAIGYIAFLVTKVVDINVEL